MGYTLWRVNLPYSSSMRICRSWSRAEFERPEVDVPGAVIDFFQAHILPGADDGDIDPVRVPADAAIGTHVTDLEAIKVLEGRECGRHRARRRGIDGRRRGSGYEKPGLEANQVVDVVMTQWKH